MTIGICQIIPEGWSHKTYDPDPEPWRLLPDRSRGGMGTSITDGDKADQERLREILADPELTAHYMEMHDDDWLAERQAAAPITALRVTAASPEDKARKARYNRAYLDRKKNRQEAT